MRAPTVREGLLISFLDLVRGGFLTLSTTIFIRARELLLGLPLLPSQGTILRYFLNRTVTTNRTIGLPLTISGL